MCFWWFWGRTGGSTRTKSMSRGVKVLQTAPPHYTATWLHFHNDHKTTTPLQPQQPAPITTKTLLLAPYPTPRALSTRPLESPVSTTPRTALHCPGPHTNISCINPPNLPPPQLTVQLPLPFTHSFGCGHIHKKAPFPVRSTVVKLVRA